jgi:two-component system, LytTR family, response regulator
MKRFNCIVIDDEPLACKGMVEYISEVDSLNMVAAVNSPAEAIKYLPVTDLMYLDINMPKISGIDFLQQVKNPPLTIITTAYQQYALQSYELDVVDYLLKPISFPRFLKATSKAIDYLQLLDRENAENKSSKTDEFFFVKSNGILEKIFLSEIQAIESLSNYITIHCNEKKIIAYLTLKQIKEHLPPEMFIQVHKSYIVAVHKIDKIDRDSIIMNNLIIPVGLNFKDVISQQILNGKLLKR